MLKKDYSLLPWEGMDEVVTCLMQGLNKYPRDDWKTRGYERKDLLNKMQRHLKSAMEGDYVDEDGFLHVSAVAVNALIYLSLFSYDDWGVNFNGVTKDPVSITEMYSEEFGSNKGNK